MEITKDWIYSKTRLGLREKCLSTLLRNFGSHVNADGTPEHSSESIYNCAHDWVSQGNPTSDGIINFYEEHYNNE